MSEISNLKSQIGRAARQLWLGLPLLLAALLALSAAPQDSALGRIDFPASGSPEAQQHFLRGVLALHSFWFEEALEAFRESTKTDPDFAMGYWGEAMALNHPLWDEQDYEGGRRAIGKVRDTSRITSRERRYIEAVRLLYGEGDKLTRDLAYSAAMEKIYRDYPDDLEAACFYALSLLGTVRPGDKGFRAQVRAGAIALDVFQKNPDHPGAAHYIIHSFDDPEHAILALPAARRYAAIAPAAHHARHMPSHIFLQLGMWPEAARSNESAWAASDEWVRRKNLPGRLRDFHSLHWLLYVYLQQGRYAKAAEALALRQKLMAESGGSAGPGMPTQMAGRYAPDMAASLVLETEDWKRAGELFPARESTAPRAAESGEHAAHGAQSPAAAGTPSRGEILGAFVPGYVAARSGSPNATQSIAELRGYLKRLLAAGETYRARMVAVMEMEVTALASASKKDFASAIAIMKRATQLEEEMSPPSGPPDLIKPSHEVFGEILLAAGKPKEAAQQFEVSLLRQPNRARSLVGLARAYGQSGERAKAIAAYEQFLAVWKEADPQLAELREARDFVQHNGTPAAGR